MSDTREPARFITVAESQVVVNGTSLPVAWTTSSEIGLKRPAKIEPTTAILERQTYSDEGQLLHVTRQEIRITDVNEADASEMHYEPLGEAVTTKASELSADEVASLSR